MRVDYAVSPVWSSRSRRKNSSASKGKLYRTIPTPIHSNGIVAAARKNCTTAKICWITTVLLSLLQPGPSWNVKPVPSKRGSAPQAKRTSGVFSGRAVTLNTAEEIRKTLKQIYPDVDDDAFSIEGGMRVRAVTLGTYRCIAFQTDYWPRHEGVRAVAQSATTTAQPVREALVEMGSSGYAVSVPRCVPRESPGIV